MSWFLLRQYEPVAQSIYLLNVCYLYSILSRGYLPQVIMTYCAVILPAYLIYRRLVLDIYEFFKPLHVSHSVRHGDGGIAFAVSICWQLNKD